MADASPREQPPIPRPDSNDLLSRELASRYQAMFEQSIDSIVVMDPVGNVVDFNTAAHENLGYTREEFAAMTIADLEAAESPAEVREHMANIVKNGYDRFETRHRAKSGEIRNVLVTVQTISIGGKEFALGTWRDITEQHQAHELADRYRGIFEQSMDAVVVIDDQGGFIDFNAAAHANLGYTREEFAALNAFDIETRTPEEMADIIEEIRREGHGRVETCHRCKDGRILDVLVTIKRIHIGGKRLSLSVWHDITEQRQSRELAGRYRAVFEQSVDSIFVVDETGQWIDFNTAAHESLGYTREEFTGMGISDIVVRPPQEAHARFAQVFTDGYGQFEISHRCKNGDIRDVLLVARTITIGGEAFMLVTCHDITEEHRARQAVEQKNVALSEMLTQVQRAKDDVGGHVRDNLEKVILPMIDDILADAPEQCQPRLLAVKAGLEDVLTPFATKISAIEGLTPTELRMCQLIRTDIPTKQIAEMEHVSPATVSKHRENIRRKLGIQGKGINLASHLANLLQD